MNILRNKYAVIGASQSGKTYYITHDLIKDITHDSVILCGNDLNLEDYKKATTKKVTYFGNDGHLVVEKLKKLMNYLLSKKKLLKTGQRMIETLVIFDDFIDPRIIKGQPFLDFLATCRHANMTIIYVSHSVDIVLTPFMKSNLTHFILCQYAATRNFNEFLSAFLIPVITDELTALNGYIPDNYQIDRRKNRILNEAFNGRFGKLIISVVDRRYQVVKPVEKYKNVGAYKESNVDDREATINDSQKSKRGLITDREKNHAEILNTLEKVENEIGDEETYEKEVGDDEEIISEEKPKRKPRQPPKKKTP